MRRAILLFIVIALPGCACRAPLDVSGDDEQVRFSVNERYRITDLEVVTWNDDGERSLVWQVHGPGELSMDYGDAPAEFETTYEPSPRRLERGEVYAVRVRCRDENARQCSRTQMFGILPEGNFVMRCRSLQACRGLMTSEYVN
jgi:hypothetical protein